MVPSTSPLRSPNPANVIPSTSSAASAPSTHSRRPLVLPGTAPLNPGRPHGDRQRSLLLALVDADPGIHIQRAAHVLGMNWNTCYHHVRRMAGEGLLLMAKVRGRLCLFDPKDGSVSRHAVHVVLRDARTASIVRILVATPGINQQDVAGRVGIAPSAAYRHLSLLQELGLIERVRQAREVINHPTRLLCEALEALDGGANRPAVSLATDEPDVQAVSGFAGL